jgi:hypothetical protein
MTVAVEHDDRFFGDQKMPVASNAVVEPSLAPKQRAIAKRPDNKLVPKAGRMPRWAGSAAFPKLHGKALNAQSGPEEKAAESKPKLKSGHRARSPIVLQNEMRNAF